MTRFIWATLAIILATGCAGGQRAKPLPAVCSVDREDRSEPSTELWYALLLHGYDPKRGELVGPPLDCTGTPLSWESVEEGCVSRPEAPLPPGKLTPASLVLAPLEEGRQLAWVELERYPSGEVLGPVAWVDVKKHALEVHGIGSLRGNPDRVRLQIQEVSGVQLLVAEGELCHGGPSTCHRAVRILPLRGSRFVSEPLSTDSGECAGPAWFPIQRDQEVRLSTGWRRSFVFSATLEFQPDQLLIHEQMAVRDFDPSQASAPPGLSRTSQENRSVRVTPDRLLVDIPLSLWERSRGVSP